MALRESPNSFAAWLTDSVRLLPMIEDSHIRRILSTGLALASRKKESNRHQRRPKQGSNNRLLRMLALIQACFASVSSLIWGEPGRMRDGYEPTADVEAPPGRRVAPMVVRCQSEKNQSQ